MFSGVRRLEIVCASHVPPRPTGQTLQPIASDDSREPKSTTQTFRNQRALRSIRFRNSGSPERIEWNTMQCNRVQRNGMESYAQNGMECHPWLKIATGSFPIGTPGLPKPVPEAPRDSKIRVGEHFEQQVGLPWPIWAAIGAL